MSLYVALGDSITAGDGASAPVYAYPVRIVNWTRSHSRTWNYGEVLAEPGWTSGALQEAVFLNSYIPLVEATAISIWIGGDDLGLTALQAARSMTGKKIEQSLLQYGKNLTVLLRVIRRISKAKLVVCTQYNPFPKSPLAEEGVAALNEVTLTVAASQSTHVGRPDLWFQGRESQLIRGYRTGTLTDVLRTGTLPIHPNDEGHKVIADGLTPLLGFSP